jgi:hypothetical protein
MSISKCVVRLRDSHDTEHSVVVYAESLYEAVIRGLKQLSDVGWGGDGETIEQVKVEIYREPTVHVVNVPKFVKWVNRSPGFPARTSGKKSSGNYLGNKRRDA